MQRYWLLFWCAVMPVFQWFALSARRGLWRPTDDTVSGLLALRLERTRAAIPIGRMMIAGMLLMLVALGVWGLLFEHHPPADAAATSRRYWSLALGALYSLLVIAATRYL